jgi:hypothetical protein
MPKTRELAYSREVVARTIPGSGVESPLMLPEQVERLHAPTWPARLSES